MVVSSKRDDRNRGTVEMVKTQKEKSSSNDKNDSKSWNTGPIQKQTVGAGTVGTV